MIATKEQERNTLAKIKKMVAELGENSYLASAFTGAFELAEQNIENDFGFTTQEYIDMANKASGTESKLNEELARTKSMLTAVEEAHRATSENFDATSERASKYAHEIDGLKEDLKAARLEIVTLKAKLYDYIAREQAGA